MLVLRNARMIPSNVKKKNKRTTKCGKIQSHVMLVLYNVRMVISLNVRKKIKEPPNVTKVQSHVMLILRNVRMMLSNVRKNNGTTKYDKSTITYDVSTTQSEDGTIKYEKNK